MAENVKVNYLPATSVERMALTDKLTAELSEILNELHGTSYSLRFWKIIFSSYITSVISRKELFAAKVLAFAPLFEPINGLAHPSGKEQTIKKIRYLLKVFSTRKNFSSFGAILQHNNVAFGFHDPVSITKDVGAYLPDYFPFLGKGDASKREKAVAMANRRDDIFYKNLILQLPKIYVEHFNEILDAIPLHNAGRKILHTSFIDSFFMRFLLSKYLENGAQLHYYQHGAFYGEVQDHNAHAHEAALADKFITWGWKLTEKDTPGKAYRLEKFKLEYLAAKKEPVYDCLFCLPTIKNTNRDTFRGYIDNLSNNLDKNKYGRLIARPRPKNKLPFLPTRIDFPVSKSIMVDSGKSNMAVLIAKSRLVIQFAVPSTNFTECLYVDEPTVGLLTNQKPTDIVRPYYDFFLETGVLHTDFNSLISHLNTIQLEEWWAGVTACPEYLAFKNEFLKAV